MVGLAESVKSINRKCYTKTLDLLSACSEIAAVSEKVPHARQSLLCANEKEYLSTFYIYIKRLLAALKKDAELFDFFVQEVDRSIRSLPEELVNQLVEDLAFLFFPDFSSMEKSVAAFLRSSKGMLLRLFKTFTNENNYLLFENNYILVNKLLAKFMDTNENNCYFEMLFHKMYDEALDLSKFIKYLNKKKMGEDQTEEVEDDAKKDESYVMIYYGHSQSFDSAAKSKAEDKLISEETKIPVGAGEILKDSNIKLLCNWIIHRITKKVSYMPMGVRYLCKFLEQLAAQHVLLLDA